MFRQIRKISVRATRRVRLVAGVQIVALLLLSIVAYPIHAFDYAKSSSTYIDGSSVEVVATTTLAYPVTEPLGVSQGFHGIHRGIDIRARKGTPVVAVDEGVVVEVRQDTLGYGKHIRIAHKGVVSSLYAHLSQIEVAVGDRVTAGEEIGQVGTTGWATGPHLHFELLEGMRQIDPIGMLPRLFYK